MLVLTGLLVLAGFADAQPVPGVRETVALTDSIYQRLVNAYVEKPPLGQVFRSGIDASLATLDPYTNYMNAEEAQEFKFSLQARYGGLGVVIFTYHDSVFVKEVFRNAPADKGGLRPGDILLKIDTVSLNGKQLDDIFPMLRGLPGSRVSCTYYRPSTRKISVLSLTREFVVMPSVPYAGILPGNLGYIRLTSETAQTFDEVSQALATLKKSPLNGLVLDLRGNTGGLMQQGIRVANLFLEKGKVAVSEKSCYADTTHYFMDEPVDTRIPLVVLVDAQTASSGEILAGALQDHDRAILIGQSSFGKGMVQKLFDLPDGGLLKLTTAFYFTPAGRCIQRKEKGGERTVNWTDTLKTTVFTARGRPLVSFDGISPDIILEKMPEPPVIRDLTDWNNPHLFRFAGIYCNTHPAIKDAATFRITDQDYADFIVFLKTEGFGLTSESEEQLKALEETLKSEGYLASLQTEISTLREKISREKEKQYRLYKEPVRKLLEGEIVSRYFYQGGRIENALKDDPEIQKAIEVLSGWEQYKQVLKW